MTATLPTFHHNCSDCHFVRTLVTKSLGSVDVHVHKDDDEDGPYRMTFLQWGSGHMLFWDGGGHHMYGERVDPATRDALVGVAADVLREHQETTPGETEVQCG